MMKTMNGETMPHPADIRDDHRKLFRAILAENGLTPNTAESFEYQIGFFVWHTDSKGRNKETAIRAYTDDRELAKYVQKEFKTRQTKNIAQAYAGVSVVQRKAGKKTFGNLRRKGAK